MIDWSSPKEYLGSFEVFKEGRRWHWRCSECLEVSPKIMSEGHAAAAGRRHMKMCRGITTVYIDGVWAVRCLPCKKSFERADKRLARMCHRTHERMHHNGFVRRGENEHAPRGPYRRKRPVRGST